MTLLSAIISHLDTWAPAELAAPWDTIGLQLGNSNAPIQSILLSLDVDTTVLNHINTHVIDLVITHHPIFFKPISKINYNDDMGQIISTFITTQTHLFSMHTNLDATINGVNDALLNMYKFSRNDGLPIEGDFGRYFTLTSPVSLSTLTNVMPCQVVGKYQNQVSRIGFLAGSGHGALKNVKELGLDCFITGELTYHDYVYCELNNITAILLGHKESETPVLPHIQTKLLELNNAFDITILD